jgi:glyoxylase-like metal-dependent hydrolase (beta-lactamase superfamily II)
MLLERMIVGPLQSCCYLVGPAEGTDCLVIDPGGDGDKIVARLQARGRTPSAILNTHGHIDHIAGNTELKNAFPAAKLIIHKDDEICLRKPLRNLSLLTGQLYKSPPADQIVEEEGEWRLGGLTFRILHVPGHTPGSICLYAHPASAPRPVLFSGDTLFAGGIGRTDFPGGDTEQLLTAIREKLFTLPEETVVYPGHGPSSTIGYERQTNPFLLG